MPSAKPKSTDIRTSHQTHTTKPREASPQQLVKTAARQVQRAGDVKSSKTTAKSKAVLVSRGDAKASSQKPVKGGAQNVKVKSNGSASVNRSVKQPAKEAVSQSDTQHDISGIVAEAKNYLTGKPHQLSGEQKFLTKLWAALSYGLKVGKPLKFGESPQLLGKTDVPSLLSNLGKAGNHPKILSKSIQLVKNLQVRALFENDGQQFMLLGNLRYLPEGSARVREASLIQVRISKMEAAQLALKPGQTLSADQLKKVFGERIHYIEMVDQKLLAARLEAQVSEGEGGETYLKPGHFYEESLPPAPLPLFPFLRPPK